MQINIDILVLVIIICCEHNKVETVPKDITSITDNWPTCWGCLAIKIADIINFTALPTYSYTIPKPYPKFVQSVVNRFSGLLSTVLLCNHVLTILSCCFTRGSTWTSTCLKIWRATWPTDPLVDIQGLNVCCCLGGEVMIWSIGSTRNRWLTRRGKQSLTVEHSGNWDCIIHKPRKMKKQKQTLVGRYLEWFLKHY